MVPDEKYILAYGNSVVSTFHMHFLHSLLPHYLVHPYIIPYKLTHSNTPVIVILFRGVIFEKKKFMSDFGFYRMDEMMWY